MSTTVLAGETHDKQISEVGDTGLTQFHFPRHETRVTRDFKDDGLLVKEILFLKRFVEVELDSLFPRFYQLDFLLSLFGRESYLHQLLNTPLEVTQLDALVRQRIVDIPDVRVPAWITNADGQREMRAL